MHNREKEMLEAKVGALIAFSPNMEIDLDTSLERWNKGDYDYLENEKRRLGIAWKQQISGRKQRTNELKTLIQQEQTRKERMRLLAIISQILGLFLGFFYKIS
jgi:hypothetical protein